METVIRLCALCLTGALLAVLLKRTNPDVALLLAVAVCGAALLLLAEPLGQVRDLFTQLLDWGGLPTDLFLPLVKTVGIALVSRTGSDLCRDAGESALAGRVELAGRVTLLTLAAPLLIGLTAQLTSLLPAG